MPLGKKQFSLLLLVEYRGKVCTTEIHRLLGTGAYKTVQAALNKLTIKNLLSVEKRRNRLVYSLTEAGQKEVYSFKSTLCDKCWTLEMMRSLYG